MPKTWSNQAGRTGLLGCGPNFWAAGEVVGRGCAPRFRHFQGLKVPKTWSNQGGPNWASGLQGRWSGRWHRKHGVIKKPNWASGLCSAFSAWSNQGGRTGLLGCRGGGGKGAVLRVFGTLKAESAKKHGVIGGRRMGFWAAGEWWEGGCAGGRTGLLGCREVLRIFGTLGG